MYNIIFHGETPEAFPPRSGRHRTTPGTTAFQCHTGVPASAVRQEKNVNDTQIGKEDAQLSLFADDMVTCAENPKNVFKKLLELTCSYSYAPLYNGETF